METWLSDKDANESIDEFGAPFRLDWDASVNGRFLVEGCVFMWMSIDVKALWSEKSVSASLCPPYLPWEFPQLFVIASYIHLRANEERSFESDTWSYWEAAICISWCAPSTDFSNCLLNKVLKHFNQYAHCHTRQNEILDQCYGSIQGVHKSLPLPLLCTFNNTCVLLPHCFKEQESPHQTKLRVLLWRKCYS